MPHTTTRGTHTAARIDARRATVVGLASFTTLTLVPLLTHAKPSERALLLLAAIPTAALFGYLAGYAAATTPGSTVGSTAGSVPHLQAAALQTAALQAAQVSDLQLRAAQLQAAQPSAPVIRLIGEPIPTPGTGSPIGSGHLAALARPPAEQHHQLQREQQHGLHLVPAPSRKASTTGPAAGAAGRAAAGAAPSGLSGSDPHLTLIVTHPTQHTTR